tara:strand:+ start:3627 stop:4337 length:711 start_codon:yes stop_codon:yes gene_type:complete
MNAFLKILKLLLITALFFFLLSFTLKNEHKNERKINLIEFDKSMERFVTKDEILASCFNWQDDNQIQNLDVAKIEDNIRQIPQINDVNVYLNHNGNVDIKLNERVPILRIYDGKSSYYLDKNCKIMPLSKSFTARKLLVSGDLEGFAVDDLCKLFYIIESNDFYKNLITQISLKKNNVMLITRIRGLEINIGNLNFLETKFNNLMSFYSKIIKFKGWDCYYEVNLKYLDQIICSKK